MRGVICLLCRYAKRGYVFGYISHFDGLDTGSVVAHLVEGKVSKVHPGPDLLFFWYPACFLLKAHMG